MRKEAGFEVMDRIKITYTAGDKIKGIFEKYGADISGDVLADSVSEGALSGYEKEWKINGEDVTLAVEKI